MDGHHYKHRTRLVITPHFSYSSNFLPQFRVSPADWKALQQQKPSCVAVMSPANGITVVLPPSDHPTDTVVLELSADPVKAKAAISMLREFSAAWPILGAGYYDPHAMMASVLDEMYRVGELAWKQNSNGVGYLARTEGSCRFCVNRHWQFPGECRYGKTAEATPPAGFLEKVAAKIVETGRPSDPARPDDFVLKALPMLGKRRT